MQNSFIDDEIEAGIDEAGRGCLCVEYILLL